MHVTHPLAITFFLFACFEHYESRPPSMAANGAVERHKRSETVANKVIAGNESNLLIAQYGWSKNICKHLQEITVQEVNCDKVLSRSVFWGSIYSSSGKDGSICRLLQTIERICGSQSSTAASSTTTLEPTMTTPESTKITTELMPETTASTILTTELTPETTASTTLTTELTPETTPSTILTTELTPEITASTTIIPTAANTTEPTEVFSCTGDNRSCLSPPDCPLGQFVLTILSCPLPLICCIMTS